MFWHGNCDLFNYEEEIMEDEMNNDKIVIRQKDKTLLKGKSINFHSCRPSFKMLLLSGEKTTVQIEDLKANFPVKDYTGNQDYIYFISVTDDLTA